ncbi:hypothetical protein AAC387_Pa07g2606 [Persea americana]
MSFKFQNLLSAPYRGMNVLVADNSLLSPVENRIAATDLTKSQTQTLPCKASSNISCITISPDVVFLITTPPTRSSSTFATLSSEAPGFRNCWIVLKKPKIYKTLSPKIDENQTIMLPAHIRKRN